MRKLGKTVNRQQSHLLVVLFVGLCSIYMISFSARIESTDNLFVFDAIGSVLHFGDTRLDVSAGVRPPPQGRLRALNYTRCLILKLN